MSSSIDRIFEALESNPSGLCDDCLMAISNVRPRQQVNSVCNRLRIKNALIRERAACLKCQRNKLVSKLGCSVMGDISVKVQERPVPIGYRRTGGVLAPDSERLDSERRHMVEMLDSVEGAKAKGRGFSERVSRLRDSGSLPSNIACMMQTVNSLRNLCVYEGHILIGQELRVSEAAWEVVKEWWKNRS